MFCFLHRKWSGANQMAPCDYTLKQPVVLEIHYQFLPFVSAELQHFGKVWIHLTESSDQGRAGFASLSQHCVDHASCSVCSVFCSEWLHFIRTYNVTLKKFIQKPVQIRFRYSVSKLCPNWAQPLLWCPVLCWDIVLWSFPSWIWKINRKKRFNLNYKCNYNYMSCNSQ